MFTCKWLLISENAYKAQCSQWVVCENLESLAIVKYCKCCGKRIKVVEK